MNRRGEDRAARAARWLLLVWIGLGLGCGQRIAAVETSQAGAEHADLRAALRVRVSPVERGALGRASEVTGVVSPFRTAHVAAEVAGRVLTRHAEPGAAVPAGEPLLELESTHLDAALDEAQASLASREVDLAEARRELGRGDELFERGALSEGRRDSLRFGVERAESARALAAAAVARAADSQANAVIRAPFDGTVESVTVHVGDYLAAGTPVATVADFGRVRVRAGVTAADAAHLSAGSRAAISLAALGGLRRDAEVHSVGRIADPTTGTYPVELWLDDPAGQLRGGMVARVEFAGDPGESVLHAPRAALVRRGGELAVFVVEEAEDGGTALARPVRVGRQGDTHVELLEGVREDELVVVDGQFALSDGARVTIDGEAGEQAAWND
jgi:RND family efflux transporter MFP subunit